MAGRELTATPGDREPAVPFERSFDGLYGLELLSAGDGTVTARLAVGPHVLDRLGEVPSGVFAAIAESLASQGTALALVAGGNQAMGLSNDTTRLAPVSAGTIHAKATAVARGADNWVWVVEAAGDDGRPCAFSRVTIAVRPAQAGR